MASAIARSGKPVGRGQLLVYGVDRSDPLKEHYPRLGAVQPLNTPDGAAFLRRLVEHTKPEVVFFDSVMSLMVGDQKGR